MLSFSDGKPIARIVGGKYNKAVLFIDDPTKKEEKKCCEKCTDKCTAKNKCCEKCPGKGGCMSCGKGGEMKKPTKEIKLPEGKLMPVPNIDIEKRDVLYVAGASGSGKSTYTSYYIEQFKKIFHDWPIFIFSNVEKDEVLDKLKPCRIKLDEELVNDPIEAKELINSICVFDDIDTITNKSVNEAVRKLRDKLLETGRHESVYMICTSHQLMNYKHTRTLLNEATAVTFFPQSGSTYHIKRFLKEYCGLEEKQIRRILMLPSRWVTIGKLYPMYVLYEKGCYLLNNDV